MKSEFPDHRPVDVFVECTLETPAGQIAIDGSGGAITVSARGSAAYLALLRAAPFGRGRRKAAIRQLNDLLGAAGIAVSLQVGQRELARVGDGVTGGLISGLLDIPGFRIRPLALLRTLLSYRPLTRQVSP